MKLIEIWLIVIFMMFSVMVPMFNTVPQDPYINISLENKTICIDRVYGAYVDIQVKSNIYNVSKWEECSFLGAYQQEMLKENIYEGTEIVLGKGQWIAWVRNLSGNHSYMIICPEGLKSNILQIEAVVC